MLYFDTFLKKESALPSVTSNYFFLLFIDCEEKHLFEKAASYIP